MKTCNVCGQVKELADFYRHRCYKDGYRSTCKSCTTIREMEYRHGEARRAYDAAYHATHINKESRRVYDLRYAKSPKGDAYRKAYSKEYRKTARAKELARVYAQSDKGKMKALRSRHKQRAGREIISNLTATDWEQIKADYGYACAYCERTDRQLEMEHFIPLVLGGHHVKENVVPSCHSCNVKKGNKLATTARQIRTFVDRLLGFH